MTWLDQPIDLTHFPLQPIVITAHASAQAGIVSFEVLIDGESLADLSADGGRLEVVETVWEPAEAGTYDVSVIATDGEGNPGDAARSTVFIGDVAEDGLLGFEARGACDDVDAVFIQINPPVVEPGSCAIASWQVYAPEEWPVIVNDAGVPSFGEMPLCAESDTPVSLIIETPGGLCRRDAVLLVGDEDIGQPDSEPNGEQGDVFVFFEAMPPEIQQGECSILVWEAGPEDEIALLLDGEPVPAFGEQEVCPPETETYELLIEFRGEVLAEFATVTVLGTEGGAEPTEAEGGVTSTPLPGATTIPGVTNTPGTANTPGVTDTPPPVATTAAPPADTTKPVIGFPSYDASFCYTTCTSGTACGDESFYITVSVTDNVSSGNDIAVRLNWTGSGVRSGPVSMNWSGSGNSYFRYVGAFQNPGTLSSFSITATDKAGNQAKLFMTNWQLNVEQCGCGG
jgi:hypothetical protein